MKFTLTNKAGGTALSASKLYVTAGGTTYTVTPSSAASELYVAIPGFTSQQVTLTAQNGTTYYDFTKTGVSFTNGK